MPNALKLIDAIGVGVNGVLTSEATITPLMAAALTGVNTDMSFAGRIFL